jgi:transposase-like protein
MEKPNKQTLERLYLGEGKSLADIGRLYGVHKQQVRRWLHQAAVPVRSISEGTRLSGKFGVQSEAHRESLRQNAWKARAAITEESYAKGSATRKANKIPSWNKGGKSSEETRAKLREQRSTPEYRQAQSNRLRGERSPLWRGGITDAEKLRLQGWEWRQRRLGVYARDNWTCQDCKKKCVSKGDPKLKIACHHVIRRRDGGTDELSNLVTLCASCHMRREARYSTALFA